MPVAPDADGGDQLVDDGGVATLLIQETTEPEAVFDKDETLPNHENSANPVIKCVLQWQKDSISPVANKWTRMSDHEKKKMNSAIDGGMGHFGNEIDTSGLDDSEDTYFGNIKPQVGCFVFPDGPGAIMMSSDQILTVSNITLDHTQKMRNDTINGNIGHFGDEIDRTGLENSAENANVGNKSL